MSYTASYIVNSNSAQGTTDFTFTFPYIKEEHIEVYLNYTKITQGTGSNQYQVITNVSPKLIRLNTGLASANLRVEVRRNSSLGSPLVDYADGSTLTANDLDTSALQSLYIDQELKDNQSKTVSVDEDTGLPSLGESGTNLRLTNVADPTAAQDAATKNYVDTTAEPKSAKLTELATMAQNTANALADLTATEVQAIDGLTASTDELNKLDGVTATTTELNYIDGVTSNVQTQLDAKQPLDAELTELATMGSTTASALADLTQAEVQILDGATVTTDELNILDGVTATTTELNYVDGVTSNVQTQLNAKQGLHENLTTWAAASTNTVNALRDLTNTEAAILDGATVTTDELNILDGVTASTAEINKLDGVTASTTELNLLDGLTATTAELNKLDGVTATTDELNKTDGLLATPAELNTLDGITSNTSELNKLDGVTASTAELNIVAGKTFKTSSGTLDTTSDTEIPSAKVIAAHVASSQTAIGGFVTIADEVSFPNTQPANGVVVSINNAAGVVINSSGVSTSGKRVDNTTVTINGFPSSLNGETLAAGVGLIVVSTSTANTYSYHKILSSETDVKQLSDDINDFNSRYRIASSAPGSSNDAGDLYFDTSANKMKVYNGTTNAWDDVASVGNFYINTISSSSGTGGGSATFNGSAYRFTLSNPPTMAQQLIVSVNGVIQKPNSGTSQPSEGFAISGNDIIFSAAPESGSDYFIVTQGSSVSIGTPSDNTVTSAKIVDGSIVNGDISSSANIAGSKLADDSITEVKLDVHNAPATGKYLKYTSNGMEWSDGASEGTDVKSTGESGGTKFLREDGDGSSSWQTIDLSSKAGLSSDNSFSGLNGFSGTTNLHGAVVSFSNGTSSSAATWTKADNRFKLEDNGKIAFGTSNDLELYHDGSHSWVKNTTGNVVVHTGTGRFKVWSGSNEEMIDAAPNGAVKLMYDDSLKLETTSSGINVTGTVNVNGSPLSAAPTITATATGSIAANTAVHVKSDGTVQTAVVTAPAYSSLGTTSSGEDDYPQCTVYKASTDSILMVFKDAGNGRPTGMVGTISGSTISWGAETALMNNNDYDVEGGLSVVVDPSDGAYVMTYDANSGGNYTRWQIFTVSDTTITNDGSAMGTVDTNNNENSLMVCTGPNTFVISYNDGPGQKARKGSRSGNSITWSSETTLYSNDYAQWSHLSGPGKIVMPYSSGGIQVKILDVAAMSVSSAVEIDTSNANKIDSAACGPNNIIVVYRRDSSSYNLYVIAGYMADGDSSVTWGSAVDVGVACDKPVVHYNSSTGNAVVSYSKIVSGSPNGRYVRDISFSGTNNTTCTAGSETTLHYSSSNSTSNVSYNKRNSVHCSKNGQDVFIFNISNTGPRYKARTGESSSMNDENFIGFSDANSYTNGQTATINVVGNTTTQSGLTPGQKYYLANDGSIGTTKRSITVPAGIALSSTKLLIKG